MTPLPLVLDVAAGDDVYAAVRALPDDPTTAVSQVVRVRDGEVEEVAGETALLDPLDVVVGPGGVAYVLDVGHEAVIAVEPDGTAEPAVEGIPDLDGLSQIALDGDGRLWITAGDRVLLARLR